MRIGATGFLIWTVGNPVFHRIDDQLKPGGYAGFDDWPVAAQVSGWAGAQGNMDFGHLPDLRVQPSAGPVQTGQMTLDDVVMKTLGLFAIVVAAGAASWFAVLDNTGLRIPLLLGGILGSLALGLVIYFKDALSVRLIVLFAVMEGVLVGAISGVFGDAYAGVVRTAVLAAVSTFAGLFLAWRLGFVTVTDRSRRIFAMAVLGYLLFSLANLVAMLMGVGDTWGFGGGGLLGLGVSVLVVGLASYSLVVDFDTVERALDAGLPEKYSWLMAHGLIVSLVWLYLEFLRLLAILRH